MKLVLFVLKNKEKGVEKKEGEEAAYHADRARRQGLVE